LQCDASDEGLLPDIGLLHGRGLLRDRLWPGEQKPGATTPTGDSGKASDKDAKKTEAKTRKKSEPE